ncbi:hd domain-containing protein [Stagonosporopsis vannaccii]|nr:hd domain-containing protein [Stagonosporopsis vannaccii]
MATAPSPSKVPTPKVPIAEDYAPLFTAINAYVHTYMSQYDSSHDYQHILRVVSNANRILQAESKTDPTETYDTTSLFLAALLHDVGDHKYAKPGEDTENQVRNILLDHGVGADMAAKVQTLVKHVSYTNEVRNPQSVIDVLAQHPELAIVQDADRLDAIGAVGIGRCFSFGAAKFPDQPMGRAIDHFEEKLYKLGEMMKTECGKGLARRRTEVLRAFAEEWREEERLSFALN